MSQPLKEYAMQKTLIIEQFMAKIYLKNSHFSVSLSGANCHIFPHVSNDKQKRSLSWKSLITHCVIIHYVYLLLECCSLLLAHWLLTTKVFLPLLLMVNFHVKLKCLQVFSNVYFFTIYVKTKSNCKKKKVKLINLMIN